ncbi:MAG: glutamate--tRNA ligase [Nitrospinae bacterium]|nr:glutamate--tRNA ligase [Nitrospinota bacterium]
MSVVTRFAPSPTGALHIGGARTALFNWLYARNKKGRFILRIEDTDRERSTQESTDEIIASLKWLGMDWDDGPFFQSQRTALYEGKVDRLLAEGKAYRCYCTKEELDKKREEMVASGKKQMYDRFCRNRADGDPARPHVVRFKTPMTGATAFTDTLRGVVSTPNEELDDFIIRRSDGGVMYNFVVVVDDAEMGITHVIRGDDHIANTPKQVNIYRGLGCEPPSFTHVSMILGPDKKRLSKRHGAESVIEYRAEGYLPDAMINMLARMGWGFGDQELFTREELVNNFSIEKITLSPAVFDKEKLAWLNMQHIKRTPDEKLAEMLLPLVARRHPGATVQNLPALIPLLKERSRTLVEMAEGTDFYFVKDAQPDESARKFLVPHNIAVLTGVLKMVEQSASMDHEALNAKFKELAEELSVKMKDVAQPVRAALTGRTVSPGVFEMIAILGKYETVRRLEAAVEKIRQSQK